MKAQVLLEIRARPHLAILDLLGVRVGLALVFGLGTHVPPGYHDDLLGRRGLRARQSVDVLLGFGQRELLPVRARDHDCGLVAKFILADADDVAPLVAAGLPVPVQRAPRSHSQERCEYHALEVATRQILEVDGVNRARENEFEAFGL